ncbi:hypothetical protein [Brevibacterium jeotgali]|uniref:Calpain catalytic domain-containing protein n=1 Tax=Brevibacterium jeotgali TaxID=1262550 RepID=A0A2H1L0L4_9MICO|nr:hypothetical protein [Brevibacterium jeotgali]TWC02196.1 hypothetical protein FB108_0864 [Brevibacterium jeotgali]SMY10454.1 hypothetical protein BJEO58_00020 [Brevibacterium jeotgali]
MPHATDPLDGSITLARRPRGLARRVLPSLLDPAAWPADRMAAARLIDRAQTTSLTALPAPEALRQMLLRRLGPSPGPSVWESLSRSLMRTRAVSALHWARGLEPIPRGPQRFVAVPLGALTSRSHRVRQGRLGDCWLVAAMSACELIDPGFLRGLIAHEGDVSSDTPESVDGSVPPDSSVRLVRVDLFEPARAGPVLRRIPFLPVRRRRIVMSTRVPLAHRAGDGRMRPSAASLVEKAAALVWASGSYRRLQNDFAGIGFLLLTGRWCPARAVPRTTEHIATWLEAGRPVVLSTLARPGGSFTLPREDGAGDVALMDAHVYTAVRTLRCTEDGRPDPSAPLRLHVRNPVSAGDSPRLRRTDLYLSGRQLRRAFISVNVGPPLD